MKVKLTVKINRVHPTVDQRVFPGIGQAPFVNPRSAATYSQRDLLNKFENYQLHYSYPPVEYDLKGNTYFSIILGVKYASFVPQSNFWWLYLYLNEKKFRSVHVKKFGNEKILFFYFWERKFRSEIKIWFWHDIVSCSM